MRYAFAVAQSVDVNPMWLCLKTEARRCGGYGAFIGEMLHPDSSY